MVKNAGFAFIVFLMATAVVYAPYPGENCEGVVCNAPPPKFCEGNMVKTYYGNGTCSNGQCSYSYYKAADCPNGCLNGACVQSDCVVGGCSGQLGPAIERVRTAPSVVPCR